MGNVHFFHFLDWLGVPPIFIWGTCLVWLSILMCRAGKKHTQETLQKILLFTLEPVLQNGWKLACGNHCVYLKLGQIIESDISITQVEEIFKHWSKINKSLWIFYFFLNFLETPNRLKRTYQYPSVLKIADGFKMIFTRPRKLIKIFLCSSSNIWLKIIWNSTTIDTESGF